MIEDSKYCLDIAISHSPTAHWKLENHRPRMHSNPGDETTDIDDMASYRTYHDQASCMHKHPYSLLHIDDLIKPSRKQSARPFVPVTNGGHTLSFPNS